MRVKRPWLTAALARAAAVALLVLPLAGLTAQPAGATISGGCTGTATDSTGKAVPATIPLESTATWNVSKDSKLSGSGKAPADQTMGYAYAMAFGFGFIPIAGGTGHGQTGSGSLDVSAISQYARVIPVAGSSDSCSGSLVVIVQDQTVLDTLAGKAAVVLALVGLVGTIGVFFRRS